MQQTRVRRPGMCTHEPQCPSVDDIGRAAARVVVTHPEQGWSLLCNGVVLFDDGGLLLPDGGAERARPSRGRCVAADDRASRAGHLAPSTGERDHETPARGRRVRSGMRAARLLHRA